MWGASNPVSRITSLGALGVWEVVAILGGGRRVQGGMEGNLKEVWTGAPLTLGPGEGFQGPGQQPPEPVSGPPLCPR